MSIRKDLGGFVTKENKRFQKLVTERGESQEKTGENAIEKLLKMVPEKSVTKM